MKARGRRARAGIAGRPGERGGRETDLTGTALGSVATQIPTAAQIAESERRQDCWAETLRSAVTSGSLGEVRPAGDDARRPRHGPRSLTERRGRPTRVPIVESGGRNSRARARAWPPPISRLVRGGRGRSGKSLSAPRSALVGARKPIPDRTCPLSMVVAVGLVVEGQACQTDQVSFNQYEPYGPVVETTMRVVSWNVWGRYGNWKQRQDGIEATLVAASPDVVCLVESWSAPEGTQAAAVANRLGFEHSVFVGDWQQDDWISGIGLASRWPVGSSECRALTVEGAASPGAALSAEIDGPRGPIQLFVVMLDYPLGASAIRQAQVRQLAGFIAEMTRRRHPLVVCGDFNAGPDSDEVRMLTGRSATAAPGLVFYDAWEMAGDGSAGVTWSNRNPLAAVAMYPDRRFDYVLSAWPRRGAVGHPVHCDLLGAVDTTEPHLSDHYGVMADLRY